MAAFMTFLKQPIDVDVEEAPAHPGWKAKKWVAVSPHCLQMGDRLANICPSTLASLPSGVIVFKVCLSRSGMPISII